MQFIGVHRWLESEGDDDNGYKDAAVDNDDNGDDGGVFVDVVDRRRALTLDITPPEGTSLEDAIAILQEHVEPQLMNLLPDDGEISYYGSAAITSKLSTNERKSPLINKYKTTMASIKLRAMLESAILLVLIKIGRSRLRMACSTAERRARPSRSAIRV